MRWSRRLRSTPKRWGINHSGRPRRLAGSHQESFFFPLRAPRQAIDFPCPDQYLAVTLHDPYQHYKNQCRCSDVYLFVHSAGTDLTYVKDILTQFCILSRPFNWLSLSYTSFELNWLVICLISQFLFEISKCAANLKPHFQRIKNDIYMHLEEPDYHSLRTPRGSWVCFLLKNLVPPARHAPCWASDIIVATWLGFWKG